MRYVSGLIYLGSNFINAHIGFENGKIKEISKGSYRGKKLVAKGLVIPTFINAHTHIADATIPFEPVGKLEDVVGVNGLKQKFLNSVSEKVLYNSMRVSTSLMQNAGVSTFCDFREGGLKGVKILLRAANIIKPIVLGRPLRNLYKKSEIDCILKYADGIGVSSITDWAYSELQKVALATRRKNKIFALHASERMRENIDKILDLKPNFIVHFIHATPSDMERCAQEDIPIVVCPRANALFGKLPDIKRMVEKRLVVTFGTDNCMFASPSILQELEFAYRYGKVNKKTALPPATLLKMALVNARKVLNVKNGCSIREDEDASFIVFKGLPSLHNSPAYWLIAEASVTNIELIVMRGVCVYESKTSNDKKSVVRKGARK